MTNPLGGSGDKFIGFFRLADACDRPGCPVCRCLQFDAEQYLEGLLYEQVNDPDTRKRLYSSWGFCSWHAWMLPKTPDPAFGSSIIYADLLRLAIERLERRSLRRVLGLHGRLAWLRRLLAKRRPPVLVELYGRRASCPACQATADSETRYLHAALQFVDDPQFDIAYERSPGLCVPHAIRALELAAGPRADRLITRTLSKWAELRRDLSGFVAKHDYRNIEPFTEAEGTGYLRAFETLVGASGVFGNDAHRGQRADDEESRRTIARLRAEIARLRAELEGVRSAHE